MTFDDAVKKAQELGVAESDPTDDIEGVDAAVKVVALANVLMGADLNSAMLNALVSERLAAICVTLATQAKSGSWCAALTARLTAV